MSNRCEYCDSVIPSGAKECPGCGAPVDERGGTGPKTIEELKRWYEARKLPPYETTRFFIGINYREPRAFGIYEENGVFTVYKNKNDGSRAIRYQGTDEACAVSELLAKLKSEILNRKARNAGGTTRTAGPDNAVTKSPLYSIFAAIGAMALASVGIGYYFAALALLVGVPLAVRALNKNASFRASNPWWDEVSRILDKIKIPYLLVVLALMFVMGARSNAPKYYSYGDDIYCNYGDYYYLYAGDNYYPVYSVPDQLQENPKAYRMDTSAPEWNERYNFKESDYYLASQSSSDSDSDYDWSSSDSWDSGGTDFDSDW